MPGLAFAAAHWRAIGALVIVAVLYGYIETLRLERDHAYKAEAQAKADLLLFKTETAALGKKAEADKMAREAAGKKRKEDTDAEHKNAVAALTADNDRLRRERARRGFLPVPRPNADRPDRADFDRAQLERALQRLDAGVSGLVDEGSKAIVDLNSAKKWAQSAPGSR